jgi:hypothetical protein
MGIKLLVCYPSGAGGWWLTNLIHKLEINQFQNEEARVKNFHQHPQSTNVYVSHYPITPLPDNLVFENKINFTGDCFFNFYLNVVEKLYINSKKIYLDAEHYSNDCHLLSCEALNKFNFPNEVDLEYQLLFTDPTKFIDQLFAHLDHSKIAYTKNTKLCQSSIQQFQRSCNNPVTYINDYSNIIWLGWCVGLLKYMQQPVPAYDSQLADNLQQYHKLFADITKDKILNF